MHKYRLTYWETQQEALNGLMPKHVVENVYAWSELEANERAGALTNWWKAKLLERDTSRPRDLNVYEYGD